MERKAKKRDLLHRYFQAINATCTWTAPDICELPICSVCGRYKLGKNALIKVVNGKDYVACRACQNEAAKRNRARNKGESVQKRRMSVPELVAWYFQEHGWNGCWVGHYKSPRDAMMRWNGRLMRVGRAIYEHCSKQCLMPGWVLDHHWSDEFGLMGCGNSDCHNWHHVRVVTPAENALSGDSPAAKNARKTHCKNGHPLLYERGGQRICGRCDKPPEYRNPKQDTLFDLGPYEKDVVCVL